MPLSDYLFDQTNIQSAVNTLESLIQNINNYTLPDITNTINIVNTSSIQINKVLLNFNDKIIPLLINILEDGTHQK